MADWKFQTLLTENNIDGLDDACLNKKFVDQARQFLVASQNKEAHLGKLHELDDDLVKLFWELHEVIEEEDAEKVSAIKMNQQSQRTIADMQVELKELRDRQVEMDRLKAENVELAKLKAEKAEREKLMKLRAERIEADRVKAERVEAERVEAERVEAERIEAERIEAERVEAERIEAEKNAIPPTPNEEELLQKKRDRLLVVLAEAHKTRKSIKQTDLIELGVPADKFKNWVSFRYEGYEFLRPIFGNTWDVTK
jgi:hypothetical protein